MRVMMRMMFKDAEGELGGSDSCSQPVTFYISRAQKFYPTHIFPMMMIVISFTGDYHDIITVVLLCFEFPARFIFQDYDEAKVHIPSKTRNSPVISCKIQESAKNFQ